MAFVSMARQQLGCLRGAQTDDPQIGGVNPAQAHVKCAVAGQDGRGCSCSQKLVSIGGDEAKSGRRLLDPDVAGEGRQSG